MKWKINRKNRRVQTLPHVFISVYIARGVLIYRRRLTPLKGSDPPRTSLKSRIAPQNCCTNNNQWKMLIQLCIRSTKVTADEIGWTPIRNFGTMWFIRSRYWFFGPIRYSSPAPHLIMMMRNVQMVMMSCNCMCIYSMYIITCLCRKLCCR